MSKTMPNSTKEEKYRWIKPILEKQITIKNMINVCPFSERALKYWLANFRKYGMAGLENRSTRPKTHPNETPIRIKEQVIELRKTTGKCAKKLHWQLENEKHIKLHERTIGKIIKNEGLVRKYRIRKINYKYVKIQFKPGELVEIDIKYVPKRLGNKRYFQFTAIDKGSRWRYIKIYDQMTNSNALKFLQELLDIAPFSIKAIKTDNGSYFTNRYTGYLKSTDPLFPRIHPLDELCDKLDIRHYLIDPGKPAQNGTVERSHRTDQEYFYDKVDFKNINELNYKLKLWNMYYNDMEHCSLNGLSPNQALKLQVQNVRA